MNQDKKVENAQDVGILKRIVRNFYPTYIYDKVENIPYDLIKENNIKLLLFDMDNTLIDNNHTYSKELKEWAKGIKKEGIELYILSNSPFGKVVKKIAKELGMQYKYKALKPSLKGYNKILEEKKIPKENIMMIGDQLFTDIWGGNRFGIKTILVRPINKKEAFISKIKRPFEKIILKHYLRKKGEL